jgi:hypothetical protein
VPPPYFGRGSNGCAGELVSCVVSVDELIVVGFAFTCDVCVQESGNPHSGHASLGANFYIYTNLPLYS